MSAGEAALQLIATQAFALGGTITPDPKAPKESKSAEEPPSSRAVMFSINGASLRETLLLNLVSYDPSNEVPFGDSQDCPAWERESHSCLTWRAPRGITDLLTWQSRRVILFSMPSRPDYVQHQIAYLKGEGVLKSFALKGRDRMVGWETVSRSRKSDLDSIPFRFKRDRGVWRDAHSLYMKTAGDFSRPPVLDWLDKLLEETLDPEMNLRLNAQGMRTNPGKIAKVDAWHFEALPLARQDSGTAETIETDRKVAGHCKPELRNSAK